MNSCSECQRRDVIVRHDRAEVRRLARMMAQSDRNAQQYAPDLARAKEHLAQATQILAAHQAECQDGAA